MIISNLLAEHGSTYYCASVRGFSATWLAPAASNKLHQTWLTDSKGSVSGAIIDGLSDAKGESVNPLTSRPGLFGGVRDDVGVGGP